MGPVYMQTILFCTFVVMIKPTKMNRDLLRLQKWATLNRLSVNTMKTNYMWFAYGRSVSDKIGNVSLLLDGKELSEATSFDYLGFRLDKQLNFEQMACEIYNDCNQQVFHLSKIRRFIDDKICLRLYKSHVLSRLQYGLVFCQHTRNGPIKRLQRLQNKALRIVYLANRYVSNKELHTKAKVLPIVLMMKRDTYIQMFHKVKRLSTVISNQNRSVVNTRINAGPILDCVLPKTAMFARSIAYRGPRLWAELPAEIRNINEIEIFRAQVMNTIQAEFNDMINV